MFGVETYHLETKSAHSIETMGEPIRLGGAESLM
jgi:hypothetical protein